MSTSPPNVGNQWDKELEAINSELEGSSKLSNPKGNLSKIDSEQILLEKKCIVLIKLKKYCDAVEEGYKIIGRHGPRTIIYKCVLIGLAKLNKIEEVHTALDTWKKSMGKEKDPQILEIRQKMENYLNAIRCGMNPEDILFNFETILDLDYEWKIRQNMSMLYNWKYRPPPKNGTFHLCPRISSGECIYGNECSGAHSKEELAEWIKRQEISKQIANGIRPNLEDIDMKRSQPKKDPTARPFNFTLPTDLAAPQTYIPFGQFFLENLRKKAQENKHNLEGIFRENLPDIQLKTSSKDPLKKVGCKATTWTLVICSKNALKAAALVGDEHRKHFYISEAEFISTKSATLDLFEHHEHNMIHPKLQVLKAFIHHEKIKEYGGGVWPKSLYYKIKVTFDAAGADPKTTFNQSIVFDFDKLDTYLIKHLSVEPKPQDFTRPIIDSESGFPVPQNNTIENEVEEPIIDVPLTKTNYCSQMLESVKREQKLHEKELTFFNLHVGTLKFIKGFTMGEIKREAPPGRLFTIIEISNPMPEYLLQVCSSVHIFTDQYTYLCSICDVLNKLFVIQIGMRMVTDLKLENGSELNNIRIHFISNSLYPGMAATLSKFQNISNFIFPDLNVLIPKIGRILSELQCKAMRMILEPIQTPPILILGPFQTGKTLVIAETIKKLVRRECKILVCTHSNVAADLYITEFLQPWTLNGTVKPMRLYDTNQFWLSIPDKVKPYTLKGSELGSSLRIPTKEDLMFKYNVIVSTYQSVNLLNGLGLGRDYFTHIFLDEANQVLEIEALHPLSFGSPSSKVVLAGDCHGMPKEMRHKSGSLTLLERLNRAYPNGHPCKFIFHENYGSHESILQFSSLMYRMPIRAASKQFRHPEYYPLTFVNRDGVEVLSDVNASYFNLSEVSEIGNQVVNLYRSWPEQWLSMQAERSLIVLSAYGEQVSRIRGHLKSRGLDWIKVEKVENAIGEHYKVVIISTVRTTTDSEFFSNIRLINSAFSRACNLIMVVGCGKSLITYGACKEFWQNFIKRAYEHKSAFGFDKKESDETVEFAERILAKIEPPPRSPLPISSPNVNAILPPLMSNGFSVPQLSFLSSPESPPPTTTSAMQGTMQMPAKPDSDSFSNRSKSPASSTTEDYIFPKLYQSSPPTSLPTSSLMSLPKTVSVAAEKPRGLFDMDREFELNGISSAGIGEYTEETKGGAIQPPRASSGGGGGEDREYTHQSLYEESDDISYIPYMGGSVSATTSPPLTTYFENGTRYSAFGFNGNSQPDPKFCQTLERLCMESKKGKNGSVSANSSSLSTSKSNSVEDLMVKGGSNDFPSLMESVKGKKGNNGSNKKGSSINGKNGSSTQAGPPSTWTKVPAKKKPTKAEGQEEGALTTEEKISHLMGMGFDRKKIIKALQYTECDLVKTLEMLLAQNK